MSAVFAVDVLCNQITAPQRYSEFLRTPAMSAGLYLLRAGETDKQSPHHEDEIYYVVRGRAKIRTGSREDFVQTGSVIFVEREAEHRFFDIEEDLLLLVVFAPAETA